MKCELRADVAVYRCAVIAEFAWFERRPELAALCKAARTSNRCIDIALLRQVLPGVSSSGALNILEWCSALGLVDRKGLLTGIGESVADHGDAPVPEQGIFELWFVDHELLGKRILHAERLRIDRDVRFEELVPLPKIPAANIPFRSVVRAERFMLRQLLQPTGLVSSRDRSTCTIHWSIDLLAESEVFKLEGTIDHGDTVSQIRHDAERANIHVPKLRESIAFEQLARHGKWSPTDKRLEVRFDKLPEAAQEQFVHTYSIGTLVVANKGQYENVQLQKVPIGPLSGNDAQAWAFARMERALSKDSSYRTRRDVRHLFAAHVAGTPLERFRPRLPDHQSLITSRSSSPAFFGLAAPVDLAPTPVDAEELKAFVVESAVSSASIVRQEGGAS